MDQLWEITLGDLLTKIAQKYPDHPAVLYTDRDFRKTYKEFNEICEETARGFLAMGVKKGDNVAIWATNYPEWIIAMFALAKIGAVLVTVNTNYKIFELEYLLKQSDTKTLILIDGFKDSDYVKIINDLCPELKNAEPGKLENKNLPMLKNIIHIGEKSQPGMFQWEDLKELAKKVSFEELKEVEKTLNPNDVINMQYTSGTTGFPKGVMLTHRNIINNGKSIGDRMKFTHEDRLCIPVPFFHCFGVVLAILASVTHGTTMVPLDYYRPLAVMKAVTKEKCTALHGVPTMFIAILEHPDFDKYDFSTLRTGIMAGSPCPRKVMELVIEKMHMNEITIVYGLTEASPGCTQTTTTDPIDLKVSTVGTVFDHVECDIIDPETGKSLPPNVTGEFIAKGYNIMKGYYNMPEATKKVIDDEGWLHTGDIGSRDENGYYKITGRMKDMIIRGGENIYPKEIEEFLYTHPAIYDVQVIGMPDEQYGEEIMACIILREGKTLAKEAVQDFVRANMARHKVPKYISFVDSFPMTASGKVQKFKLKEQAGKDLGLISSDCDEII